MAGPIAAVAFYGSSGRRSEPLAAQLEAAAARLQRAPLYRPARLSLLGPAVTWRVFSRQAAALQVAAASPGLRLMVFGCEERVPDGGGRRSYLVCHPSVFWQCDQQKPADDRCSYEVIRQEVPCKLYLDLEFDRTLNPERDGDAMVETLIRVIATVVDHLFKVKCTRSDVIDMCASSKKKFSRHLIFCCKGLVFCDNITVGNLVRDICDAVRSFVLRDETEDLCRLGLQKFSKNELGLLLVNSSNQNSIFCDEGVYTKNRNFRVYKSSKFGKQRPLIKSVHNTYSPQTKPSRTGRDADDPEETFFLASLVSVMEGSSTRLEYGVRRGQDAASACLTAPAQRRSSSESGAPAVSPYPDVDAFVRDLVSPGGIRCWSYFDVSELLVYDIVGFRFCQNIGRWHRSNNIIIVVSLREASFYQKCHDPACRGFRSDSRPLPSRLLAWRELADDWDGGGDREAQFPDCGASDTEMLSAAVLAEPGSGGEPGSGSARAQSARRRETTSGAEDWRHGLAGTAAGAANMKPGLGGTAAGAADITPGLGGTAAGAADIKPGLTGTAAGVVDMKPGLTGTAAGAADMEPGLTGTTAEVVDMEPGPPVTAAGAADLKLCPAQAAGELTEPDLFPDCGVADGDLAEVPAGVCLSQHSCDGRELASNPPISDPFPDCGVEDDEMLAELSTEPLPNCGAGDGDDQCTAPLAISDGPDAFPDCGVGDADLPAVPCSGGQRRSLSAADEHDLFPDCGVGDWELAGPAEPPDRAQELFPDWRLSDESPEMFPDCGVGDWELSEVGRSAAATADPGDASDTSTSAHTAHTATSAHTAHTPSTGSDQLYYTAPGSSCHDWDDLTEADMGDWQF